MSLFEPGSGLCRNGQRMSEKPQRPIETWRGYDVVGLGDEQVFVPWFELERYAGIATQPCALAILVGEKSSADHSNAFSLHRLDVVPLVRGLRLPRFW
jgi:hypothetical protein